MDTCRVALTCMLFALDRHDKHIIPDRQTNQSNNITLDVTEIIVHILSFYS